MAGENYYSTLGVKEDAGDAEIKKAYRKLAVKYHPDKNQGDKKAEENFKNMSEAYYALGDPKRRKEYDDLRRMGAQTGGFSSAQGFDASEFMKHFSGGGGFPEDHTYDDIFSGFFSDRGKAGRKSRYTYYYSPDSRPGGRGEVTYNDVETDIKAVLPVPGELARKGGEAKFKISGSRNITLKIPAGTKSGQKLRLRDQGQKCPHCSHKGDLIVTIRIK